MEGGGDTLAGTRAVVACLDFDQNSDIFPKIVYYVRCFINTNLTIRDFVRILGLHIPIYPNNEIIYYLGRKREIPSNTLVASGT